MLHLVGQANIVVQCMVLFHRKMLNPFLEEANLSVLLQNTVSAMQWRATYVFLLLLWGGWRSSPRRRRPDTTTDAGEEGSCKGGSSRVLSLRKDCGA